LEGPTEAAEARNIEVVRKYYDGCNSGDIDELMGTFPPDVTHYFLPSSFPPIHGAEALARHWKWWKDNLDPIWAHDHLIAARSPDRLRRRGRVGMERHLHPTRKRQAADQPRH
jgi:ketosteroid isomerase-like protein